VIPNVNQPRKQFSETALKELADSIRIHGVIQPIVVNKLEDNKYMIIAGERRWRASKIARKTTIPAIMQNYTDKQIAEVSLIENLQREDLNPIEAARAIKKLMQEYDFTQETVADRIGKSRSVIANTLRLLNLYPEIIKMVENDELSAGHARCLVVVDDVNMQLKFANQAKNNKMTVRDLEKAVKEYLNPKQKVIKIQSLELKEMVSEMSKLFSTKVSILGNDNKGRIFIDYYTKDDLDRIYELLELIKEKTLTLKDLQNLNNRNKGK
ncbi:MAG: ParB/RepB/Spo0J family partition protein, partial [Christensenellales bacterium]